MSKLREQILNAQDEQTETVTVPEWLDADGQPIVVEVRGMNGSERAQFLASVVGPDGEKPDLGKTYPAVLKLCAYDPADHSRIFEDGDDDLINAKSGAALERIAIVAMRLSGLDKDAQDRLGKVS